MSGTPRTPTAPVSSLRSFAPRADARIRLVCFPHAGGAAGTFRAWAVDAPADVEVYAVQYAGRGDRFHEEAAGSMDALVGPIATDLLRAQFGAAPENVVLFGHSMGAVAAYETARLLAARGQAPAALIVSGHPAPALARGDTVHRGTDAELLADLRRLGGAAAELLDDEDLMEVMLPTIRLDYQAIETYRRRPGPRLSMPVTALYGDRDDEVLAHEADGWREETEGDCTAVVFPGAHFFLEEQSASVLAQVVSSARAAVLGDQPDARASGR
ncbi:thioesterase II family protein [Streptomyces sp. NBC_00893]|uniref:thioesterase II family protein n=1 Tax=Streptomyces sp. NBC_00893 TaxID=2975862 RepID=UPI00225364CF|nr:alpha/beta fold hydrolase [Streptomyces sp. NBC_00893]MCX4849529.1 alpha/beta fold hydrolase [Streptomyces sp. NBC_00893]